MENSTKELNLEQMETVNGAGFLDVLKEICEFFLDGISGADA